MADSIVEIDDITVAIVEEKEIEVVAVAEQGPPGVGGSGGDLADAVVLAPDDSARNVIESPGPTVTPLKIKAAPAQTAKLLEVVDENDNRIMSYGAFGFGGSGLRLDDPNNADREIEMTINDTYLNFDASDGFTTGFGFGCTTHPTFGGSYFYINGKDNQSELIPMIQATLGPAGGYANIFEVTQARTMAIAIDFPEQSNPATPPAGTSRVYSRDNAGKTELVVKFDDGSVVPLAVQP